MYNEVIKLISYTESTDNYGLTTRTETTTEVFAKMQSIGTAEFYQAQASGLKPTVKFVIADYYDYNGEKEVEWNSTRYNVLRTYRNDNTIELTCIGVNE